MNTGTMGKAIEDERDKEREHCEMANVKIKFL